MTNTTKTTDRIYALDWLRCFAFILLVWTHTALLFTAFGWHLKFEQINGITHFIEFCRPWRMPLIFLVSGAALSFSLAKRGPIAFSIQSTKRLLPPLLFGIFVLIPPVLYFESAQTEQPISLFAAYKIYLENLAAGDFRWLHLWYLGYLLAFCFGGAIVWPYIAGAVRYIQNFQFTVKACTYLALLGLAVPIIAVEVFLRPHFPVQRNFVSDIASVAIFTYIFFCGATIFRNATVMETVAKFKWVSFILGWFTFIPYLSATGKVERFLIGADAWLWILFFLGLAYSYFNRSSKAVAKFNTIVFPFYLIHQLAILAVASITSQWLSGWALFVTAALLACIASILIIYYLMMPIKLAHFMFGISPSKKNAKRTEKKSGFYGVSAETSNS